MKKTLLFILSLFAQFSFAQTDSLVLYFKKGEFNKAIVYGEKQKNSSRIKDNDYAILVNNLATAYSRIDDYKNAEINYLEELELEKSFFGENHKIVAKTYRNLGNILSANKELEKAKENYLKAIGIIEKTEGKDASDYSEFLLDLAITYQDLKDNKNAEQSYITVCDLLLKNKGENNILYQKALMSTAMFYNRSNNNEKAEGFFLKSYRLQKINLRNETLSTFIFTIDIIALYFNNKNQLDLAEKFYQESKEIKEKSFGVNDLDYIQTLINLGMFYTKLNNNEESTKYLEKANKGLININKENSADNAFVLNSLANKKSFAGKYEEAEKLFEKVIEIYEKLSLKSNEYFDAKIALALNYQNKGDFENAENVFLELIKNTKNINDYAFFRTLTFTIDFYLEIQNKEKAKNYIIEFEVLYSKLKPTLKEFDIIHDYYYRGLQSYYSSINQYDEALKFAFKRLNVIERNPLFGSESRAYFITISDIGLIYKSLGNYVDWKVYKFKAYNFIKDKIGNNPRNDASLLIDIANIYNFENNKVEAEKYYLEAIKILENNVSKNINLYDDALLNIVSFYFENDNNNNNNKVNLFLQKLLLKNKLDLEKYVEFLSESEFSKIKPLIERGRTFSYNILQSSPNQYPEINIACFENQLLLKNLSLRNQERIKTTIEKSSDATVKEKYQHFIENKRYLTKLDEIPISERPKNYEAIKTDTENLEKELTRLSSTFADAKKSLAVNWKQVQEKLKPNEIAIDLVDYTYYNKKWTDSIYYGAFIIKKDSKFPKYITLFEKKQLAFLLSGNKNQQDSTKINKHYLDKAISDLFLKPLQNELKGVSSIYLSPSGLGHQINFSALPVSETQTLGDKYELHILGSTAEMVTYNETNINKKTNTELVLYGNIDYKKSDATNKVASDTLATKNSAFTALYTRSANTGEYGYLEGSKTEINTINALAQQNNLASTIVEDRKATEESVKALDGRTTPFVLHLATHGFFFPDVAKEIPNEIISPETTKKTYYKIAEDPMMRSGLILAGANKNLKKSSEGDTIDDGILTASEISNLDLSACQLVVLSACETGLGQINGSEGVFGLQRAFKMAGVKYIIMSLWKVPDVQTAELFDVFYTECFAGKTIREAFQTAQAKMKAKYPPYFWAGFVLLE